MGQCMKLHMQKICSCSAKYLDGLREKLQKWKNELGIKNLKIKIRNTSIRWKKKKKHKKFKRFIHANSEGKLVMVKPISSQDGDY